MYLYVSKLIYFCTYIQIHTDTYRYIQIHTIKGYIQIHTYTDDIYRYIHIVHNTYRMYT